MSCSFHKYGNLWDDNPSGPIEGRYEKECNNDNSYSKQASYFYSSDMPTNLDQTRQSLTSFTSDNSIFGNIGNFFNNMFSNKKIEETAPPPKTLPQVTGGKYKQKSKKRSRVNKRKSQKSKSRKNKYAKTY